jgi:hypothetical protein
MQSAAIAALGYDRSPSFVRSCELEARTCYSHHHVYRKARAECGLEGVYLLDDPTRPAEVPVVFCCRAENEADASRIHRCVWNQNVVPFVLIETPRKVRLYSGFRFAPDRAGDFESGVLEASLAFTEVATRLAALRADAIDTGAVWDRWHDALDTRARVDWSLLEELRRLETELRKRGLDRGHTHALIGKFIYLKYLRERKILSDRKLAKWHLTAADLFGNNAKVEAFGEANRHLDEWLNGAVFPMPGDAVRADHLQLVARVFIGGTAAGQLAMDLGIFDFAFIPIETISTIYEQFLHAPEEGRESRGREAGAYYTPIPVVNYMLGELESRRPLAEGMRVLDPSCGSGTFLVQCYRTLVEKRLRRGEVRPAELRDLLTRHIFGVDRDGDACQVTELSLILALLDYTTPPDLENSPQFRLPTLRGNNIFHADYFDPESGWASRRDALKVDWLVGNPPWRDARDTVPDDRLALEWMRGHAGEYPVGGNQVAEAFVWHSLPLLAENAAAALLLPAMTLFKLESTRFRAQFFQTVQAWCVANFANLAYVLFAGRSQSPALALFFQPRHGSEEGPAPDERLLAFTPLLANQRASRTAGRGRLRDTWGVVVNGAELRELRPAAIADGGFRAWKTAMWGSSRDDKLLARMAGRFPSLAEFATEHELRVHEGFQLRVADSGEDTQPMPELAGAKQVDFDKLRKCGRIFAFPPEAISTIPTEMAYVRSRGGLAGVGVSRPPHVIVDASRRFAVFSDEFIAVPPRKIGIAGPRRVADLLKALSVYLSSRFCVYQQFFTTPEWGVRTSLATLDALRSMPVPLGRLSDAERRDWAALQEHLAAESRSRGTPSDASLDELDDRVCRILGITPAERLLVEDFVRWDMQLVKGKVMAGVVAAPSLRDLQAYLTTLKGELDDFVGRDADVSHSVQAVRAEASAMLAVRLVRGAAEPPIVVSAHQTTAAALARVREQLLERHSQWLYFERCLTVYQGGAMYVLKPLEMIHWTRRQAVLDADEIVAETLGGQHA